jgi:hypothetical protein
VLASVAVVLAIALLVAMQAQHWGLFFLVLAAEIGVITIQITWGQKSKGFKNLEMLEKD